MAVHTRALRASIALIHVLIFALAFASLYPFPSGDISVDLPSPNDIEWGYSGGIVSVTAPFSIRNGGFFDIQDLTVDYEVTNYTLTTIASDSHDIGTVSAGTVHSGALEFTFDILELYNSGVDWMVFNDDLLNFRVEVSCGYTMGLVKFDAEYRVSVPWDALIQDIDVDDYRLSGTELQVDYHVATSDILSGSATLRATLYGNETVIDEVTSFIVLGRHFEGTIAFDLSGLEVPEYVVLEAQIGGFPVEVTIPIPAGEVVP
jgi:hypothetical protein